MMKGANENTCASCGYFIQHYIFQPFVCIKEKYQTVWYGHCMRPPRTRHRSTTAKACIHWIPIKDSTENKGAQ